MRRTIFFMFLCLALIKSTCLGWYLFLWDLVLFCSITYLQVFQGLFVWVLDILLVHSLLVFLIVVWGGEKYDMAKMVWHGKMVRGVFLGNLLVTYIIVIDFHILQLNTLLSLPKHFGIKYLFPLGSDKAFDFHNIRNLLVYIIRIIPWIRMMQST